MPTPEALVQFVREHLEAHTIAQRQEHQSLRTHLDTEFLRLASLITQQGNRTMSALDDLQASVAKTITAVSGAVADIKSLSAQVSAANSANDPKIEALAQQLSTVADTLNTAVTPAGGTPIVPSPVLPIITGISPSNGNPGDTITITGTGFTGGEDVSFGDVSVPGTGISITSDSSATATVPQPASGAGPTVPVTITTAQGTSLPVQFTYGNAQPATPPADGSNSGVTNN